MDGESQIKNLIRLLGVGSRYYPYLPHIGRRKVLVTEEFVKK
jgi:hypothetical protein